MSQIGFWIRESYSVNMHVVRLLFSIYTNNNSFSVHILLNLRSLSDQLKGAVDILYLHLKVISVMLLNVSIPKIKSTKVTQILNQSSLMPSGT